MISIIYALHAKATLDYLQLTFSPMQYLVLYTIVEGNFGAHEGGGDVECQAQIIVTVKCQL